ncbi:MAG: alcohol dehydrogenase catalytic domain-containing protein [Pyrinomonadaceae bacterium]
MKALIFTGGELKLAEVDRPAISGEALVRVTKSGICNTDVEIVRGYAGFDGTIGHEFVGIVEESADKPELVGKRVVGEINVGCGSCDRCLKGDPRHCPERTVLGIKGRDGAHAEFLTLPARNLIEVPLGVTDEQAVFVEPLAAAIGITEQVEIGPETSVAVIGDGKLGLLCAFAVSLRTKNLIIVGKHEAKLEHAESRDIETVWLPTIGKFEPVFDVVIEASGSESGFATALDMVKPRGKIVLKSTFSGKPQWEAWRVVVDEITIVGSRCGRFEPALTLLNDGKIDLSDMISAEMPLSRGVEAIAEAQKKGVMKVLLTM